MHQNQRHDMMMRQSQGNALAPHVAAQNSLASALPQETPEPSILKPILKQWWLVVLFGLIGFGAALVYLSQAQQLYTSYAKIYIEPTANSVVEAVGFGERGNYLATQVEIMTTTPLLQLVDTPEMRRLKTFAPANGNVIAFLQHELDVTLERRTDLINVELSSPWPEEAAQIVKAVVDAYIEKATTEKSEQSESLVKTLRATLAEEEQAIAAINIEKREYLKLHPLASDKNDLTGIDAENLRMVQTKYTEIELALIEAKAVLRPSHPTVVKLQAQLDELKRLRGDMLDKLTKHTTESGELQEIVARLEQRMEMARRCGDRIHQIELAMAGRQPMEIKVTEPARVAETPSYPRKKRTMAVAIVAGMLIGAGLALLRDRLDGRLRSIEEIQTVIGLPILGVVPGMSGRRTAVARAMAVHLDPRSPVAEAYRTIRTAVYFGVDGARCKTILVTSPEPGDGKTTSASNLAIAIAQTGRSVLLLDADFRKPSQHKNLEIKDAVGLSSVLAGKEPLERAIQHTGVEGLDILPCGPIPANPSEILNSREFGELVDSLAARYDHILFDSPPVNPVTDARILAAVCDATILVLRADKSTRKAGEHARNALLSVGARVLGAIVNAAPNKKGYEVYGGSYYGRTEAVTPTRRLTAAVPEHPQEDVRPRRRTGTA